MREKLEVDLEAMARELDLYENPLTEKQRSIIEAAETLFAEKGFAETPTAEIARQAGVTEKTLFKHFPTKVTLFKRVLFPALLKTLLPAQLRKVKQILAAPHHTSWVDALSEVAQDRLEVVHEIGPRLRFVFMELIQNEAFRDSFRKLWRDNIWTDVEALVVRNQESGNIRNDIDAGSVARAQIYMVAGYVATRVLFFKSAKKEEHQAELQALLKILAEGMNASKK
jgi:AcrR family transcriptional regulator